MSSRRTPDCCVRFLRWSGIGVGRKQSAGCHIRRSTWYHVPVRWHRPGGPNAPQVRPCKAYITIAIRLRYDDTTTHSTTTEVIEITICVRFDCDMTTIRLWHDYVETLACSFFARVESRWMEAGARDTSWLKYYVILLEMSSSFQQWKNFENRLSLRKLLPKIWWLPFLEHNVHRGYELSQFCSFATACSCWFCVLHIPVSAST